MPVEPWVTKHSAAEGLRSQADHSRFRIPVGANLILSMLLAGLAVGLRAPWALAVLVVVDLLYFALNRAGWPLLIKAGRFLLWQSSLLLLLHYLRFGPDGIITGMRISCQLFLAFLPGMIFIQGSSRSQLVRVASRFLSPTAAFVLGASLHFLPLLITEVKELYLAQILRGARIHRRDICKPWCWSDWVSCLIVPATVQTLALAGDIALAARVRDFGSRPTRSCWPGADASNKLEREL